MNKIFDNKPRLVFLLGLFFVAVLVAVGLVVGIFYDSVEVEKEESGVFVFEPTEEEIEEAHSQITISGTIVSVAGEEIVLKKEDGEEIRLSIDENITVEKGVSLEKSSVEELSDGQSVSALYDKRDMTVINLWYEGEEAKE